MDLVAEDGIVVVTATQSRLTQSSKSTPHTLYQTIPPPLLSSTLKQVLETYKPSLFQPCRSQSNHHQQGFSITISKISYSLIDPQLLSSVPTYTPYL